MFITRSLKRRSPFKYDPFPSLWKERETKVEDSSRGEVDKEPI